MRTRTAAALLALLSLSALVACGDDDTGADASVPAADEAPERIVSLSPSATETLFAIGAGDQVVAVDDNSNFPEGVPTTDLSGFEPNVEAIAEYDPDLVVASRDANDLVAGLEALDIPVVLQEAPADLAGAYAGIIELGEATGHVDEAEALVDDMQSTIDEIVADAAGADGLTYYYELTSDLYSATSETFIGNVIGLLGLENIADAAGNAGELYPQLSSEFVVDANPDLILLANVTCCGESAETVAARPGFAQVSAVTNGKGVVELDDDIASRWGPRIPILLEQVAAAAASVAGS